MVKLSRMDLFCIKIIKKGKKYLLLYYFFGILKWVSREFSDGVDTVKYGKSLLFSVISAQKRRKIIKKDDRKMEWKTFPFIHFISFRLHFGDI